MPASKMLLGLPLYGYVSQSTKTALTGSFVPPGSGAQSKLVPRGKNGRSGKAVNAVKEHAKADDVDLTNWYGQEIPFNDIVSSGALVLGANGAYGQGGGFTMGALFSFFTGGVCGWVGLMYAVNSLGRL